MRTTKTRVRPPVASRERERHPRAKSKTAAPSVAPPPALVVVAVGRRKTAVARVRLHPGTAGQLMVNQQPLADYFRPTHLQEVVLAPLKATGNIETISGSVRVRGGGAHGQAEAVRHGIARALTRWEPTLRATLKPHGWLRRDPRVKERKKPGLRRARRAPQWAKR